jgi:CHASE3 domain sensor protein
MNKIYIILYFILSKFYSQAIRKIKYATEFLRTRQIISNLRDVISSIDSNSTGSVTGTKNKVIDTDFQD